MMANMGMGCRIFQLTLPVALTGECTHSQVVGGAVVRPAACYLCKLPDIAGKFQLDKVRLSVSHLQIAGIESMPVVCHSQSTHEASRLDGYPNGTDAAARHTLLWNSTGSEA